MADLTDLPEGRWGLSRIVETAPRVFTVAAILQRIGVCRQVSYPPLNAAKTAYTFPFAIVHFPDGVTGTPDADTRLVPNRLLNTTLGELTAAQRNALRTQLEEWLTGYSYIDWDNTQQVKAAFSAAGYDNTTTVKRVLLDVCRHLGLTAYRPRPAVFESHNTEYTDDFSTDPSARWTGILGATIAHDAANSEMDNNTNDTDAIAYYSANDPGSIEQEAQHTYFLDGRATKDYYGTAVRVDGSATDGYVAMASNQDDLIYVFRYLAGTRSTTGSNAKTLAVDEWHTTRIAASGAAGSNVAMSIWDNNHGASKPSSDPGWYGTDGTPDWTVTDSSVDRLDASTHIKCGVGWIGGGVDWDNRASWFKERAISDRGGAIIGSLTRGKLINGILTSGRLT